MPIPFLFQNKKNYVKMLFANITVYIHRTKKKKKKKEKNWKDAYIFKDNGFNIYIKETWNWKSG